MDKQNRDDGPPDVERTPLNFSEGLRVEEFPEINEPEPEPNWKLYEKAIAHIEESAGNATVVRNHKITGRSGTERQIDVWLESNVGAQHRVTVAVECKCYNDKPVTIQDVDSFVGFLDDVRADKGVMLSHSGFTDGATKRAEVANIELSTLTLEEAEEFDWDEYMADSCGTLGDCCGTIRWEFSDGASEAGFCNNCGTFHIKCGNCSEVSFYDEDRIIDCDSCEMRWELRFSDGMVDDITELPPEPEEEDDEEEEG